MQERCSSSPPGWCTTARTLAPGRRRCWRRTWWRRASRSHHPRTRSYFQSSSGGRGATLGILSLRRRHPYKNMPPMPATTSRRNMASQKLLVVTPLVLSQFARAAIAQDDYPSRPLRIVVGFTPGGGPDLTARHIAQRLTEALRQQVIVQNRAGAGGTVAAALVAGPPTHGHPRLALAPGHAAAAASG